MATVIAHQIILICLHLSLSAVPLSAQHNNMLTISLISVIWTLNSLITIVSTSAGFSECKELSKTNGAKYIYGDCFQIKGAQNWGASNQLCKDSGGMLAIGITQEMMELLYTLLTTSQGWIGVYQKAGYTSLTDNWFWYDNDGNEWPYEHDLGRQIIFGGAGEHYGTLYPGVKINDAATGHGFNAICQFRPSHKQYRLCKENHRVNVPILEEHDNVEMIVPCAKICSKHPLCMSYSYGKNAKKCYLHQLPCEHSYTVDVEVSDYEIWAGSNY